MHERAEPGISELHLMREIWKGLARKTPWLLVTSYNQHSIKDFRDELQLRFHNNRRSDRGTWPGGRPANNKDHEKGKDPDRPRSKDGKKTRPSDRGLPPCKNCGQDHFHSECQKGQQKSFLSVGSDPQPTSSTIVPSPPASPTSPAST